MQRHLRAILDAVVLATLRATRNRGKVSATGYYGPEASTQWSTFRRRFKRFEVELPQYLGEFDRPLLTCLYSAKNNRPWGQKHKHLVEVAHRVANSEKNHLKWFMHAVRKYGRLESMKAEGQPGLWQKRYGELRTEYDTDPAPFEPRRELQPMVSFLFPELLPLP